VLAACCSSALLTCCLTASVMPVSCCADSRHTPAGLPVPGPSAKASTCRWAGGEKGSRS
jgi:hypothetical protein